MPAYQYVNVLDGLSISSVGIILRCANSHSVQPFTFATLLICISLSAFALSTL